jgi:hypothetical protein
VKLPGGLQDPWFFAFRKYHPFGVALQFFNNVADEAHGIKVTGGGESSKSISRVKVEAMKERTKPENNFDLDDHDR